MTLIYVIFSNIFLYIHRRVYHIMSYMMFYFNIFLGLVSCLLRIIYSVITGIVFLQRLQKSTLPRAFELRDPGRVLFQGG